MGTIRTVELFAGVGGFRLGLESASDRFKVIWANQWEPSMREQYAFECYTAHFGSQKYHVCQDIRFLYKGIIIKHNKTEPTYTKTSLFLCEKRRFFMARTEKGVVATI